MLTAQPPLSASLASQPTSPRAWGLATMRGGWGTGHPSTGINRNHGFLPNSSDITSVEEGKEKASYFSAFQEAPEIWKMTLPGFQRKTPTLLVFRGTRLTEALGARPMVASPPSALLTQPRADKILLRIWYVSFPSAVRSLLALEYFALWAS